MADTGQIAIQAQDLWRIYQLGGSEVQALRGLSFSLPAGRFVLLMGRSGSGKTTLLNCLCGLDQPTRGDVHVFGNDLLKMSDTQRTEWRRLKVGLVFQSFGLLPMLSAYENIELMLRLANVHADERQERTLECLRLVGLEKWAEHRPYELSGGQQQRVAVARALANRPLLILADEPTGELDSGTVREIMLLFRQIVDEEKVTFLMTSHDPNTSAYVDEVLHLKDGQIVAEDVQ